MINRNAVVMLLMAALGCAQATSEDAAGELGTMVFETTDDDCRPHRFTGSTGSLFVGATATGRLVVTSSLVSFWGPEREGAGTLIAGSRTDFSNGGDLELVLGGDPSRRCARLRYRWSDLGVDAGVRWLALKQTWQAIDLGCPEEYPYVPERDCTSTRRVRFTPERACRLQCLTPTEDDLTCGC
jgi:hypothetical protein